MKRRPSLGRRGSARRHSAVRSRAGLSRRPIRFIVPYAPGGSTDTSARIVAEKLAPLLGQPVIVENKAGGGTIIGTEIVAKAKPDGHTILLTPAAMIANAAFGVTVPYDIDKDLVPVVGFVDLPMLLAATNNAPFKTVAELLAWPKAESRPHHRLCLGRRRRADASVGRVRQGEDRPAARACRLQGQRRGVARRHRRPRAAVLRRAGADRDGDPRRPGARPGGGDDAALGAAARRADGAPRRDCPARKARSRSASRCRAARRPRW